jgi:hypothetical protein
VLVSYALCLCDFPFLSIVVTSAAGDPASCCASGLSAAGLPQLLSLLAASVTSSACCAGNCATNNPHLTSHKHSTSKAARDPNLPTTGHLINTPTYKTGLSCSIACTGCSAPQHRQFLSQQCTRALSADRFVPDRPVPRRHEITNHRSWPLFQRRLHLLAWLCLGYSPGFDSEPGYSAAPQQGRLQAPPPRPIVTALSTL